MRISDWSSYVCSSELPGIKAGSGLGRSRQGSSKPDGQGQHRRPRIAGGRPAIVADAGEIELVGEILDVELRRNPIGEVIGEIGVVDRSEESLVGKESVST